MSIHRHADINTFKIWGFALALALVPVGILNTPGTAQTVAEVATATSDTIANIREAIIGKESAHDPSAVNPHSGALGYGQVMPENVAPWTEAALGEALTPDEFLADPDAQVKTIEYQLEQMYDRALETGVDPDTAVRKVASEWYSGRQDWYDDTTPQTYGAGSYPSIDEYTQDVLNRFKDLANEEK